MLIWLIIYQIHEPRFVLYMYVYTLFGKTEESVFSTYVKKKNVSNLVQSIIKKHVNYFFSIDNYIFHFQIS